MKSRTRGVEGGVKSRIRGGGVKRRSGGVKGIVKRRTRGGREGGVKSRIRGFSRREAFEFEDSADKR